jgi:hypothetical protein
LSGQRVTRADAMQGGWARAEMLQLADRGRVIGDACGVALRPGAAQGLTIEAVREYRLHRPTWRALLPSDPVCASDR